MKINKILLFCFIFCMHYSAQAMKESSSKQTAQKIDVGRCCICLESIGRNAVVCNQVFESGTDGSKHSYHADCIQRWLDTRRDHAFCPICHATALRAENRALLLAAQAGNLARLTTAIEDGAELKINEYAVLHVAALHKHPHIVHYCFTLDPAIDKNKLLTDAIERKNVQLIQLLVEQDHALFTRILAGHHFDLAQELLKHSFLSSTYGPFSATEMQQLLCDSIKIDADVVAWLYQNYPITHEAFDTALKLAVLQNKIDIVKALASQCQTPEQLIHNAYLAAQTGKVEILRYFIEEKHIPVDILNLFLEATKTGCLEIVRSLCTHPSVQNYLENAIHLAAQYDDKEHSEIMNLLISRVNPRTLLEHTPWTRTGQRPSDLKVLKKLFETQRIASPLAAEKAAQALEHQHTAIAHYLIDEQHVPMTHILLHAQQQRLARAVTSVLTDHRDQIDVDSTILQSTELGDQQSVDFLTTDCSDEERILQTLLLAAKKQNSSMVTALLEKCTDDMLADTLHFAISLNLENLVSAIIERLQTHHYEINLPAALFHTIQVGNQNIINLFKRHYSIDAENLIAFAIDNGNEVLAIKLANQSTFSPEKAFALSCHAARKGRNEILRYLIKHHIDAHKQLDELVKSAQRFNQPATAQYLITAYPDRVDLPQLSQWTFGVGAGDLEVFIRTTAAGQPRIT